MVSRTAMQFTWEVSKHLSQPSLYSYFVLIIRWLKRTTYFTTQKPGATSICWWIQCYSEPQALSTNRNQNAKVQCCQFRNTPLSMNPRQLNPSPFVTTYIPNLHLNITIPSLFGLSNCIFHNAPHQTHRHPLSHQFPVYDMFKVKVNFSRYRRSRPLGTWKVKATGFSRLSALCRW
jgi:hypothetical protein